jgi:hypothetical protein
MADPSDESTWDTPALVAAVLAAGGTALDPLFRDAATVRRYLRARRGDVGKALDMLMKTQAWRREATPAWPAANAAVELVRKDVASGKAYIHGVDRKGRPLTFVRVCLHDAREAREEIERFVLFLIDESIARCDRPPHNSEQFSVVIDFEGFGYSNFDKDTVRVRPRMGVGRGGVQQRRGVSLPLPSPHRPCPSRSTTPPPPPPAGHFHPQDAQPELPGAHGPPVLCARELAVLGVVEGARQGGRAGGGGACGVWRRHTRRLTPRRLTLTPLPPLPPSPLSLPPSRS